MAGVNKVILIGNLGKDPELKYGQQSGTAVCRFSLATTERYGDEDKTEWHNITLFGKTAEIANEYLRKGSQVYIEGRIQTRKWQDKQGNDRYTTEILGHNMIMLGSKSDAPKKPASKPNHADDDPFSGESGPPPTDDDMPF